ncbi:MAG: right-handed parallel beta-helix repeat-containing protein [Planctomycetota bacterium]
MRILGAVMVALCVPVAAGGAEGPRARPAISAFVLPHRSDTLTFRVTKLAARGDAAGYRITQTPIPPAPSADGWNAEPPASITEKEPGVYDYYAWVKDAAGNVSLYAEQTVDVATTRITVGPKKRDFTNFVDAIYAIEKKGNPKGVVIEADAGEYASWRPQNEYRGKGSFLKNIIKIRADNLTIRGVGGRAHLAYKCRGPDTKRRWTVPPRGTQHGSVIVQAARNLRLENVEVSGGCEATSCNGAGLWIEPGGVGTVVRNCYFHHNDNGILSSRIPGARVVVLNSEFYRNGSPVLAGGQNHNLYIGEVDELVFLFNYSHASLRGQLLKSRAGRNYVLYNRLTDESRSNYPIDLPYGGESYVIGNLVHKSKTACNDTFINYGREMVMDIVYKNGGPEPLRDRMTVTNKRTGKTYRLRYNFNYGARGTWKNRDRANHCNFSIKESDGPDFKPGDRLSYGEASSIEVVKAAWKWSSPRRELYVCNNTFVNEHARGYGQYLARAHTDTRVAAARNNLIIDLHPRHDRFGLRIDASKRIDEKPVDETNNCWLAEDPGLRDIGKHDYSLRKRVARVVDKGAAPGRANGMDLAPRYEYVHPCSGRHRPDDGALDIGAYEFRPPPP